MSEADLAARSVGALTGWVTEIEAAGDPTSGGVNTYVHITTDEVVFGALPDGPIVLREPGGRIRERSEWIFGSPEYRVGEHVLVFVTQHTDGTLRTTGMSMGKFSLEQDDHGAKLALRRVGEGAALWDRKRGELVTDPEPESYELSGLVAAARAAAAKRKPGVPRLKVVPPELAEARDREHHASFTYLGSPSRWFEPDSAQPVPYFIDATGDPGLGAAESRAAIHDAFEAWSSVATSALAITDAGDVAQPTTFGGCEGGNRIMFNDPFNEVTNPVSCSGVLAIGGFCASSETRVVNGTSFRRIRVGKITFNNGWSNCPEWNRCNLAEVATHELGHTLGFGHSTDFGATMYAMAHFDDRCAELHADDLTAINFVYPIVMTPTPTRTPSPLPPTATRTATRTRTATATRTLPPTNTVTWTPAPATATWTPIPATATPIPATATWTAVPATATSTAVPATATRTVPPTGTASHTPTTAPRHRVRGRVQYYSTDRGVPGVTVSLRGPIQDATQTSSSGEYEFDGVAPGDWEVAADKASDFGDGVSSLDAAFVLQTVANLRRLDAQQQLACDVTGDGQLSALDATRILQLNVGKMARLPVGDLCGSDWTFVPDPAPMQQQSVVNPRVAAGACDEGTILLDGLLTEAEDQDFHAILFGDCTGNWGAAGAAALRRAAARTGAAKVRVGEPNLDGSRVTIPVVVRATGRYNAVDLRVAYDADQMTPVQVSLGRRMSSGLASFHAPSPGILRVAMASAEPIKRRFGKVLALEFTLADPSAEPPSVQVVEANVDEVPAVIVGNAAVRR